MFQYAKCIRKYKIGGTSYTPFFFDQEKVCVCRRTQPTATAMSGNITGNVRVPAVNLDPDDGMTVVQAKDIENGKQFYNCYKNDIYNSVSDTEYACPVTIGTPGVQVSRLTSLSLGI
jgi:hypothetical protein